MTEIERKFRVDRLPGDLGRPISIEQAYIALDHDVDVEVRVRRTGEATTFTVKRGVGLERDEIEIDIGAAKGDELISIGGDRAIVKDRYQIVLDDGLIAEIDRYFGRLAGLCVVEVEFADRAAAERFIVPDWFGAELTERPGWSNAELAVHGIPAD